jgi:hypothetical protein
MYEGLDTVVLYEELAYEDVVPLSWKRLPEPVDPILAGGYAERNLRILQVLTAMEESGKVEVDESSPNSAELARLDMKVNLLLDLMGQLLVANQPRPRPASVRFNALGAVWQAVAPHPELGAQGVLEMHLRDCIAEPLRFLGRIASISPDGRVKVRFANPGEQVADFIEKLAFRRHRRQVAGAKQPRR